MKKKPSFTCSHKFYIKYKTNKNHWVGNLITKPIDIDEFLNRRDIIPESEASFNDDDAIDASGIAEFQTETSVVAEEA